MKPLKTLLGRSTPTPATLDRVWAGIKQREASRWKGPVLMGAGAVALVAAALVTFVWTRPVPAVEAVGPVRLSGVSSPMPGVQVALAAGGEASLEHGVVQLARGAASVRVAKGARLEVSARQVRVEVAAAVVRFEVSGDGLSLVVDEGEVVVRSPSGVAQVVRAGGGWSDRPKSWRALAKEGELAKAWSVLGAEGVAAEAAGANLEEQTLLADIAVAGGARALAITVLEHAVALEGTDRGERAVAAYDLGLRYVEEGEPRLAAQAFERSIGLDLPVALQRDARARAAEAWVRAGEPARARRWLDAPEP